MTLTPLKRTLLIVAGIFVLFVVLVILFISPIAKYAIEKYDEKYTGRQITLDWAYVNPFTGSVYFNDLKVYEHQSDTVFFSADGLSVGVNMIKLLSKDYEVTKLELDKPWIAVIQNRKVFNFDDLIQKFSSKDTVKVKVNNEPVHFNLKNIKLTDGEFHYVQKEIPVNYFIKNVQFSSTGKFWDRDTIRGDYSFESGMGEGKVKGDFTVNTASYAFRVAPTITHFDLKIVDQYLKDLANYGKFSAFLDAQVRVIGNFKDGENVNITGHIAVEDFHFGKKKGEDYASFKKFSTHILDLSPKNKTYSFDSVLLVAPFFRYEKYDSLDNVQRMFGKKGSKVANAKAAQPEKFNLVLEIGDYVTTLSKNFLHSYYKLNRLAIYDANIQYGDYSLREKFELALNPLSVESDSIDRNKTKFNVTLNSGLKPYGKITSVLTMNPHINDNFDLQYAFQKIPAATFNPYIVTYTSYPFDRGIIEISGDWHVNNEVINSHNHFLFIDPRVTKRDKREESKWLPMPIILAFIRDRGNVIDYQVPITGNLNNPKFHLRDIIFDVLKNIVVKPATTSYRFEVRDVEQEIEKSHALKWGLRKSTLLSSQDNFLKKIAQFLQETPTASVSVHPIVYEEKEKEYILLFEAKKRFYFSNHKKSSPLSEEDSTNIEKVSTSDKAFKAYLDKKVRDTMVFTLQDKCQRIIGNKLVQNKYERLLKEREKVFMSYFQENGLDKRVKIQQDEPRTPFNGFSYYSIKYKGDVPDYLAKAYEDLDKLNDESPRNKYQKERKKIFGIL